MLLFGTAVPTGDAAYGQSRRSWTAAGMLVLGVNDMGVDNNSGASTVNVEVVTP
jgi:hypothetical protein